MGSGPGNLGNTLLWFPLERTVSHESNHHVRVSLMQYGWKSLSSPNVDLSTQETRTCIIPGFPCHKS